MKRRYRYIMLPIVLVALLAAMCTTASAGYYGSGCPYTNFYSGTLENGGGIYFDVKGHYDSAGATQSYTFENVPDGRQVVRMYPGIWLGSPSLGRVTEWSIEINGHVDYFNFTEPALPFCNIDCPPEDGIGEHCTVSCTGLGVCSVTYNASPYVVTGDNDVTYWTDEQIYSVGLLAVYENESMEKLQYWVKEGQEYPDMDAPYLVYFNETVNSGPINTGNISAVEYYTYGYPHCPGESGWPNLNGNYIGSPNITKDNQYAPVFYGWTEIPPAYIDAPDNCFLYPTIGNDRMMVPVLGIHYSDEPSSDLPDLEITDIRAEPGAIIYTIRNNGDTTAGSSRSRVTVDGDVQNRPSRVDELAPRATSEVTYNYRGTPTSSIMVCADCKLRVTESNEDNNCLTVTV